MAENKVTSEDVRGLVRAYLDMDKGEKILNGVAEVLNWVNDGLGVSRKLLELEDPQMIELATAMIAAMNEVYNAASEIQSSIPARIEEARRIEAEISAKLGE